MSISDWPSADRPREKLIRRGAAALSEDELLAIFQCLTDGSIVGELPGYDGRYSRQPIFIGVIKTGIRKLPQGTERRENRDVSPGAKACYSELWEMDGEDRWVPSNEKTLEVSL